MACNRPSTQCNRPGWTRRGHGGREFIHGNGFLSAAYVHRSSRAGDPQLHSHVLVANATRGPGGRWTRLYHPAIYDHAKTAGYIYEANLRHELTRRLGVRWQEVANGIAEIDGFDPDHLRALSTRRAEILAATAPDASARARQVAALETRRAKDRDLTEESLRERWRSRAEAIGLDRRAIRRTLDREPGPPARVAPGAVAEERVLQSQDRGPRLASRHSPPANLGSRCELGARRDDDVRPAKAEARHRARPDSS